MNVVKLVLWVGFVLVGFNACDSKRDSTEVRKVHWDRDMCERCKMVVSDRHHAVQVINPQTHKSYMFDDLGCTVLWFKEENITWKDKSIIWITDAKDGTWIDAKKAYYDTGNITPMAFGFAPHEHKEDIVSDKKIYTYEKASKEIFDIKKKKMKEKMMQGKMKMKGTMH